MLCHHPLKTSEVHDVYVSITGLRVKNIFQYAQFYWFAGAAMTQAKQSRGIVRVEAQMIKGVHHTLSIWEDESSMRSFIATGAHMEAMKAFGQMATGKTIGYTTDKPPAWSEVHEIWLRDGKEI